MPMLLPDERPPMKNGLLQSGLGGLFQQLLQMTDLSLVWNSRDKMPVLDAYIVGWCFDHGYFFGERCPRCYPNGDETLERCM